MAVRMDRLTRDMGDWSSLVKRSKRKGWGIILSGEDLDTTPDGKFRSYLDAALSERERDMIGVRTREAMAKMKADGYRFGREVDATFLPTYRRVLGMVESGKSLNAVARDLNAQGVPTAKGGKWYASTVKAITTSETAKTLG